VEKRLAYILLFFISAYGPAVYSESIGIGDVKGLTGIIDIIEDLIVQNEDLQAQIDALGTGGGNEPVEVTVDCGVVGESITTALADAPAGATSVTIDFVGTCQEQVMIDRDNVTLRGQGPASSVIANPGPGTPDDNITVNVVRGARNVRLENIAITGGVFVVLCAQNTEVTIVDSTVSGAPGFPPGLSIVGVIAGGGGTCTVVNTTVTGSLIGIIPNGGGTIVLVGGVIENNVLFGIQTATNGTAFLTNRIIDVPGGATLIGTPIIRANGTGINLSTGGNLHVDSADISFNSGFGIWAGGGTTIQSFIQPIHPSEILITDNVGAGLQVDPHTVVILSPNVLIQDNGAGITCFSDDGHIALGGVRIDAAELDPTCEFTGAPTPTPP